MKFALLKFSLRVWTQAPCSPSSATQKPPLCYEVRLASLPWPVRAPWYFLACWREESLAVASTYLRHSHGDSLTESHTLGIGLEGRRIFSLNRHWSCQAPSVCLQVDYSQSLCFEHVLLEIGKSLTAVRPLSSVLIQHRLFHQSVTPLAAQPGFDFIRGLGSRVSHLPFH